MSSTLTEYNHLRDEIQAVKDKLQSIYESLNTGHFQGIAGIEDVVGEICERALQCSAELKGKDTEQNLLKTDLSELFVIMQDISNVLQESVDAQKNKET